MKSQTVVDWDERYGQDEYVFGTVANDFLISVADRIKSGGRVLSLCEGEGRNGTFLAALGLDVVGVDGSEIGLAKAQKLAAAKGVRIETRVANLEDFEMESDAWDAIVLLFGHFEPELRVRVLRGIPASLKPGGVFVMEAYSRDQPDYGTGGPSDVSRLYEIGEVRELLKGLEFEIGHETVRNIREGDAHDGKSAVVQVLARKPVR